MFCFNYKVPFKELSLLWENLIEVSRDDQTQLFTEEYIASESINHQRQGP